MQPSFYIGSIPIYGQTILAPMDGITAHPFRLLARQFGSAYSVSEFISAQDALHARGSVQERLFYSADERPFGFQLLDNDPDRMVLAAQRLMRFEPDFIDVNLGCPAKDICARGAGASLLKSPDKVKEIIQKLVPAVPVPITAKIRLGWDETTLNYLEIARIIEDAGASAIAVHARTRKQAYIGTVDYNAASQIKASAKIPVIVNGDITTPEEIDRVLSLTQCDAVMIGRASMGNPWIFSRREKSDISPQEIIQTTLLHLEKNLALYGVPRGLITFRKFALRYLDRFIRSPEHRHLLVTTEDPIEFRARVSNLVNSG